MKSTLPQGKTLRGTGAFADGLRTRSIYRLETSELASRCLTLPDVGRLICAEVEKADAAILEAEKALQSAKVKRECALDELGAVLRNSWSPRELRAAGLSVPKG